MRKDIENVIIAFGLIVIVFTQGSLAYRNKAQKEYILAVRQEISERIKNKILEQMTLEQERIEQARQEELRRQQLLQEQNLAIQNAQEQQAIIDQQALNDALRLAAQEAAKQKQTITTPPPQPTRRSRAS